MQARASILLAAWVCLLGAGCRQGLDAESLLLFQRAQAAFDQARTSEDFLRAAALYREILDRPVASGALWYNQGNAFMQAGQRGRAIAAYRQAQRYRPRDPYLEANLRFAQPGDGTPRRPLIEYLLFWQDWLSYPEKFWLLGLLAGLTFALGLAARVTRRKAIARAAMAALALSLLCGVSAGYDWYRYEWIVHGVVVEADTTARKGNAASYEPALTAPLAEGTEFRLVERRGDWLLVRLPGGQEGWIEGRAAVTY